MAYLERVKMRVVRLWRELVHRFGEFVKVILRLARQDTQNTATQRCHLVPPRGTNRAPNDLGQLIQRFRADYEGRSYEHSSGAVWRYVLNEGLSFRPT